MSYHYIWNSVKERLVKRIMTKQAEAILKNNWHTELEKIANEHKFIIDGKYISDITKVSGKQK